MGGQRGENSVHLSQESCYEKGKNYPISLLWLKIGKKSFTNPVPRLLELVELKTARLQHD